MFRNKYNTKATNTTFSKTFFITKDGQYNITFRGPQLWKQYKPITYFSLRMPDAN